MLSLVPNPFGIDWFDVTAVIHPSPLLIQLADALNEGAPALTINGLEVVKNHQYMPGAKKPLFCADGVSVWTDAKANQEATSAYLYLHVGSRNCRRAPHPHIQILNVLAALNIEPEEIWPRRIDLRCDCHGDPYDINTDLVTCRGTSSVEYRDKEGITGWKFGQGEIFWRFYAKNREPKSVPGSPEWDDWTDVWQIPNAPTPILRFEVQIRRQVLRELGFDRLPITPGAESPIWNYATTWLRIASNRKGKNFGPNSPFWEIVREAGNARDPPPSRNDVRTQAESAYFWARACKDFARCVARRKPTDPPWEENLIATVNEYLQAAHAEKHGDTKR